jgi:hypothetical protein
MLLAAILRALATVHAGPVGGEQQVLHPAGQHVRLARQLRHPEAVNHVGAGERQVHRLAGGDADLVGGVELAACRLVAVAHVPPPHAAGDADHQRAGRRQRLPRGRHRQAPRHQCGQHHAGKKDAAARDPQRRPHGTRAPPQRPSQQEHHAEEDRGATREQHPSHGGDGLGGGPGRLHHAAAHFCDER